MILLHLENYHHLFASASYESIVALQQRIRHTLLTILPTYFRPSDLIGVKRCGEEEYGLFVKVNPGTGYDELQRKSLLLLRELERRLHLQAQVGTRSEQVNFVAGCYVIGPDIENTAAAVQSAYHYARSIATKKLPAHFSEARDQLLQIVKHENISVLAQPIMNLSSGEIFGWEILTRGPLNTPFHTPAELFDLAYQADLLSKMEFVVIKKAFREISERCIREQVFLNVTPVSLGHPLFLNHLLDMLRLYPGVKASQIVLEITERHAIRDFEHLGAIMKAFRAHGFRFAVDDAGAGYSSLQSISELIPDMIKIDRSVISNIDQMSVKQSLLKALLHVAEHINCEVIAEGVEREEEANTLVDMRVNMVQGFYFARPQPLVPDQERVQQLKLMQEKLEHHRRVRPA
ncbi:EAL domain-containing protein [Paenibacillus filicis]|uniref:EAL domain-containing protein n=1 Tax=Paenibacillus filicis TaxID=669464 RepID=A0ABU9DFS9_9BACL